MLDSEQGSGAELASLRLSITQMVLEEVPVQQVLENQEIEQRIHGKIHFLISGSAMKESSVAQSMCFVQLLAHELSTGRTTVLAVEQQPLHQDKTNYITLVSFSMPEVGRYQLMGMVLLPDVTIVDVALGPTLRVVL